MKKQRKVERKKLGRWEDEKKARLRDGAAWTVEVGMRKVESEKQSA
jgi:hypothetical protein